MLLIKQHNSPSILLGNNYLYTTVFSSSYGIIFPIGFLIIGNRLSLTISFRYQAIATEAIQRIDNDPKLAPRILSALKAGGTSALDSLLDHPAASFVIGALEDWQQTQSN